MHEITLIVSNRVIDFMRHGIDDLKFLVYNRIVRHKAVINSYENKWVFEHYSEQGHLR